MLTSVTQPGTFSRLIALALAFVSLWFGTVVAFEHNDDLSAYSVVTASHGGSRASSTLGLKSDDGVCLACAWEQAASQLPVAVGAPTMQSLYRIATSTARPQPLYTRTLLHPNLRAPPTLLS
jgi:hypothetical protein